MRNLTLLFAFFMMATGIVSAQCQAGFVYQTTALGPVAFYDSSSTSSGTITSWSWSFGDGTSSTMQNPIHTYNSNGPFVVCLTISTSLGCSSTYCDSLYLGGGGRGSSCSVSFGTNVSGNTAAFNAQATGTGTALSYTWNYGDGNSGSSTGGSNSHTYSSAGTYNVCVVVSMSDSCSATTCNTVVIGGGGQPTCNAQFTSQTAPAGTAVMFTDQSTASATITSWSWSFGDGTGSSVQNPTHTYANTGSYLVCLSIMTIDSCTSTYCDTVNFSSSNVPCNAAYIWYPDTSQQYSIVVVNTSTGQNPTYLWDFGDGNTSTSAYPTHTYAGAGVYNVCVTITATTALGVCTATYCDSIGVFQKRNTPFTINVISPTTSVSPHSQATSFEAIFWPNPAHGELNIEFAIDVEMPVQISLFDLNGRKVLQQNHGMLGSGRHALKVSLGDLPAGIYLARVSTGDKTAMKKIMIER